MSDIMEKTLASLPSLLASSFGGKTSTASRPFQNFIKLVGNLNSQHEEEQFVKRELSMQKQKLAQPGVTQGQMREYLIRLVYCHMLGYDVSFAHIHAVKLAQQGSLLEKRAGYLVCALLLHENHELVMLLVNTIQKDLKSSNVLEVCMALTAASQLLSTEMIPALLPYVEERMRHPKDIVRRKTVYCLHSFYMKVPDLLQHMERHFRQALCDKDPGVVWAAAHVYYDLIKRSPSSYQDLMPTLVNILHQIINCKLPQEYEYHNIPAPWLQILLLKTLALLGEENQQNSTVVYPVLKEVLQRIDPSHKIGLAVIYEGLATILSVWPHPALVEHAAKYVGKFLSSKTNNLRYLGLKALTFVVGLDPRYSLDHQEVVLDCLEHDDLTIRRKTLELLYRMANPTNVEVICNRLMDNLATSSDTYIQADIVSKVTDLADSIAPSCAKQNFFFLLGADTKHVDNRCWYIDTMNRVMMQAGHLVVLPDAISNKIISRLQNGCELSVVQYAVKTYWNLALQEKTPPVLTRVAAWVLGEFISVHGDLDPELVINRLTELFTKMGGDHVTQNWILAALLKLTCLISSPQLRIDTLKATADKNSSEIQQRLRELELWLDHPAKMSKLTVPSSKFDINQIDLSLSFLDDLVTESLERGALPYKSPSMRYLPPTGKEVNKVFSDLNFIPYESPLQSVVGSRSSPFSLEKNEDISILSSRSRGSSDGLGGLGSSQQNKVQKVWGREGLLKQTGHSILPEDPVSGTTTTTAASLQGQLFHQPVEEKEHHEETEEMAERKALKLALFGGLHGSQTHVADSTLRQPSLISTSNLASMAQVGQVAAGGKNEFAGRIQPGDVNVYIGATSPRQSEDSLPSTQTGSNQPSLKADTAAKETHSQPGQPVKGQDNILEYNSNVHTTDLHMRDQADGLQTGENYEHLDGQPSNIPAGSIYDIGFDIADYVEVNSDGPSSHSSSLLGDDAIDRTRSVTEHTEDHKLTLFEDVRLKLDHTHLEDEDYISVDSLETGNTSSKPSHPVPIKIVSVRNTEALESMGRSLDSLGSQEGTTMYSNESECNLSSSLTNLAVMEQDGDG